MKKISYIICLTAILCSCNNELPIENVQELQTPKSKEDSEILSFVFITIEQPKLIRNIRV